MKKLILCIAALSFMIGAFAQDNKLTPGPGEVELTYVGKNTQLGVWNPETRVYTIPAKYKDGPKAGQYRTLTFTDDGKVVNGDGKEVGSKQPNGSWKSPKIENVMRASYNVIWNNEIVGNILETMVSIHGLPMVQTSAPMDQDVLTFLVFCNHWGGDQINKIKEEVKKDNDRKAAEAKAKAKPVEFRKGLTADKIEVSGSEVIAYSNSKRIGKASFHGDEIYVYTQQHTGPTGRIGTASTGTGYIDFLDHTNVYSFHQFDDGDITFRKYDGTDVGSVTQWSNGYTVRTKGNSYDFPKTIDPRFGALFIYEFFDP